MCEIFVNYCHFTTEDKQWSFPAKPESNLNRRRYCVPVYICINYFFIVVSSDSCKGVDRPTRLETLLEHVRSYSLECSQHLLLSQALTRISS